MIFKPPLIIHPAPARPPNGQLQGGISVFSSPREGGSVWKWGLPTTRRNLGLFNRNTGQGQTERREGVRVGWGRGAADWLSGWKKAPSSRHTQRRDRLFSYIEHPTDNTRAVFRYFHPPGEGGQYGNGDYPPPDLSGGGQNRSIPGKMALSLVKCFFTHLLIVAHFYNK